MSIPEFPHSVRVWSEFNGMRSVRPSSVSARFDQVACLAHQMGRENQPAEDHHGNQRVQSVPYHPYVGRTDEVLIFFHLLVKALGYRLEGLE